MSGSPPRAAASAATGAICARSARRWAASARRSGVIPFIRVMDSLTLAISQGSLRRGSAAVYLPVSHPEIEEFIEIRRPTGGDPNRKALNLHHGILLPDAFMRAVEADETMAAHLAEGRQHRALHFGAQSLDSHPDRADRDRRAVPDLQRPREPRPAAASEAGRADRQDLQPLRRDHVADGAGPARPRPHRRLLPVVAQSRNLVRLEGPSAVHRGRDALPRQRARGFHRARTGGDGAREILGDARTLGRPRA